MDPETVKRKLSVTPAEQSRPLAGDSLQAAAAKYDLHPTLEAAQAPSIDLEAGSMSGAASSLPQDTSSVERVAQERIPAYWERAHRVLQNFDYKTLNDIFVEERRKSGVTTFIEPISMKSVKITTLASQLGVQHIFSDNNTRLDIDKIASTYEYLKKTSAEENESYESCLVSVLTHEAAHRYGYISSPVFGHPDEFKRVVSVLIDTLVLNKSRITGQGGYTIGERTRLKHSLHFNFFNEAVTDLIGEDAYRSYQSRTGDPSLRGMIYKDAYIPQRALLESFILKVSETAGIDRDTVWSSIKQGYFSGLDLSSTGLGELYEEYMLSELMEKLKMLRNKKDTDIAQVTEIIAGLSFKDMPEMSRARILRGLKSLQPYKKGDDAKDAKDAHEQEPLAGSIEGLAFEAIKANPYTEEDLQGIADILERLTLDASARPTMQELLDRLNLKGNTVRFYPTEVRKLAVWRILQTAAYRVNDEHFEEVCTVLDTLRPDIEAFIDSGAS